MNRLSKYFAILFTLCLFSCTKDFLEPELTKDKDVATNVNTIDDLRGIMAGAYNRMNESDYYGRDYIVFAEVRSDNAFSSGSSGRFVSPAQFVMTSNDAYSTDTWSRIYSVIVNANIVIQSEITGNDTPEVQYVKGQAYAVRALAHMDLLRLFGQQYVTGGTLGVPIITAYNDGNIYPKRATIEEVWNQVGADFAKAIEIMDPSLDGTSPTQITTWAVYALQSRYYLYIKDYAKAAVAAKKVIDSGNFSVLSKSEYTGYWNNPGEGHSLFELAYTNSDNLGNGSLFYIYQATNYGDIQVTKDLYNSYDNADVRKKLYSADESVYRMIGKYPEYTSSIKVIRYEEVILNYAEALYHLESTEDAADYLNLIAENRSNYSYETVSLDDILEERRKELAMEGHRSYDLLRNGLSIPYVDSRQTFNKNGIAYGAASLAFPIPRGEITANPNMVQNEGY
ncbi:RagB/SusD family nutrient uptake outer membrane protein [Cytophagaceae bacterium DM2B3-1]|uniref:RagB/SusD family nutrient uptake outer membrane protein n=1 Tax=Xanthocytophaga flava TaxID=3048013 RepID=A0ABT7CCC2_9BACT|nr:RagB/SusD family nutrient uptake outer membrane protein [Xanthocytophaga flavus]MDJ1491294.1 RagB/SusD family nutrient uptake outer membrane protein [Xanthocytophaga flavus]